MPSGLPSPPNAAARTALPQPPNTSQNVPRNSAPSFLPIAIATLPCGCRSGSDGTDDTIREAGPLADGAGPPRSALRQRDHLGLAGHVPEPLCLPVGLRPLDAFAGTGHEVPPDEAGAQRLAAEQHHARVGSRAQVRVAVGREHREVI